MAFMFGVLGSFIFWVVFFAISLFIGTMILKRYATTTFNQIKTGKDGKDGWSGPLDGLDIVSICFILFLIYVFWPVILVALVIGLFFKHLVWNGMRKTIIVVDTIIPVVEFKKKDNDS